MHAWLADTDTREVVRAAELTCAFAAAHARAPSRAELAACRWVACPQAPPEVVIAALGVPAGGQPASPV